MVYQLFHSGIYVLPTTFLTKNEVKLTRGHRWKLLKLRAVTLVNRAASASASTTGVGVLYPLKLCLLKYS